MDEQASRADFLATKLSDVPVAIEPISRALGKLGGAFRDVQNLTGQDLSSIRETLQKAIADPTSVTLDQVKASIQQVRHAYRSWVNDMASSFGELSVVVSAMPIPVSASHPMMSHSSTG